LPFADMVLYLSITPMIDREIPNEKSGNNVGSTFSECCSNGL
jgi:hypothetical protein